MSDQKLDELVQTESAASDNLKAVILYGSAATEEFHTKHSDLNILSIERTQRGCKLHGPVEWWVRRGQRPPLVFTLEELRWPADTFTIELLDMNPATEFCTGRMCSRTFPYRCITTRFRLSANCGPTGCVFARRFWPPRKNQRCISNHRCPRFRHSRRCFATCCSRWAKRPQ